MRRAAAARRVSRRVGARPLLKGVHLPEVAEFETSGGLKVLFAERGPLPLVALQLWLPAGSAADPKRKDGLADFTASLLRRGTRKRTADELNEAVEFCGASLACGAEEDFLSVRINAPSEHLRPMLEILAEVVRWPSFPRKEVESTRTRLLAQLANDLDDPGVVAERALLRALWDDHPYGHDVVGTAKQVRTFTRQDAVAFQRSRFGPRVGLLVIAGQGEARDVKAVAERVFGDWEGGPDRALATPPLQPPVLSGRTLLVDKPEQTQSQIRIGGRGIPRGSEDIFAASLMNTALGGSFTSRLVEAIRVKRGLSYGVSSGFERLMAAGSFAVSTFTKTETTRAAIDLCLLELAKMRRKGPSAEELDVAKRYLAGLFPLRFETNEAVAGALAEIRLFQLGDDWVERYRERLLQVTVEEARRVARKYILAEPPAIVVVGNADKVKKQLSGLGPLSVMEVSQLK